MTLTKQQIEHIANLARLDLTEDEIEIYLGELTGIIDYVSLLKEADVCDIEPTAQIAGLENIMREDEVKDCEKNIIKNILEQAPETKDKQIKLKRVLNK